MFFNTTDLTRWGIGLLRRLHAVEVDLNFWDLLSRVTALEDHSASTAVGVDYFTIVGNQLTVHMTDHTLRGPITVPVAAWNRRTDNHGQWLPLTVYSELDIFDFDGSLYFAQITFISPAIFDPNATDGMGHFLYGLLLTAPGDVVPIGGTTGQFLVKASNTNFDFHYVTEYTVPPGGVTGDRLVKHSGANGDTVWQDNTLALLEDVALVSPHDAGDILTWNGSFWDNEQPVPGITTLAALSDVALTSLVTTQVLTWNGTAWTNSAVPAPSVAYKSITDTGTTLGATGTVSLDPTLGNTFFISPSGNVTLNAASFPTGSRIWIEINTINSSGFTITFNTGFIAKGNFTTVKLSGRTDTISFISDGGSYVEVGRTAPRSTVAIATTGTVTVDSTTAETFTVTPTGAINLNANPPEVGLCMALIVTTSGTSSFVITFGTNFKSTGTLTTGTVSGKVFTVSFISDGTNFNETSRTTAM